MTWKRMTWKHDDLWCECGGATVETVGGTEVYECLSCGKVWRYVENIDDFVEVQNDGTI